MRFPKEIVAAIHEAAPESIVVKWPTSEEPQKGRVYWLQAEDAEALKNAEKKREQHRDEHPVTCREVLAGMYKRHHGKLPEGFKYKRRRPVRKRPDSYFIVLAAEPVGKTGWEATVARYQGPEPVRHLRIKAKVPAGPDPIDESHVPAELEPEQMPRVLTRPEREDQEDAFKIEHEASVDDVEIQKWEQRIKRLRERRKRTDFAEAALARAKRRAAERSAADAA